MYVRANREDNWHSLVLPHNALHSVDKFYTKTQTVKRIIVNMNKLINDEAISTAITNDVLENASKKLLFAHMHLCSSLVLISGRGEE